MIPLLTDEEAPAIKDTGDYVEWANTLDSTGSDSTDAILRLDNPSLWLLRNTMALVRTVTKEADMIKKWVFYGKLPTRWPGAGHHSGTDNNAMRNRMSGHETIRLFHAILGLLTEVGELMYTFEQYVVDGVPINKENIIEESGDLHWYQALVARWAGFTSFMPILMGNYRKLVARYGTVWSQDRAINRDTANEMKELGKGVEADSSIGGMKIVGQHMLVMSVEDYEELKNLLSLVHNQLLIGRYCSQAGPYNNVESSGNHIMVALRRAQKMLENKPNA